MACPGGRINGSGNPAPQLTTDREERLEVLYRLDHESPIKKSQDNPAVQEIYSNWLGEPTGEISHHALHTTYGRRPMRVEETLEEMLEEQDVIDLAVCVSTNCFLKGSWRILEGLSAEIRERHLTNRFRVRARFCANNCANGPSVTFGQHKVMHVDPENVAGFVEEFVLPALETDTAR